MNKNERILELINILNKASNSYYNSDQPIMSDYIFDSLYDELKQLEEETGIVYKISPTQRVGYMVVSEHAKAVHETPMLSLDKVHNTEELKDFIKNKEVYASIKCDGLTTRLIYENGVLVKAETRGDGYVGQDVLGNVLTIANIPHSIPVVEKVVVDGEVEIPYAEFRRIKDSLPEKDKERCKHPRNLASGSLQLYDSKIAATRGMKFIAWKLTEYSNAGILYFDRIKLLQSWGFTTSPGQIVNKNNITEELLYSFYEMAEEADLPMDGVVFVYNDTNYGASLGTTGKFPRDSVAYKYEDEKFETVLEDVVWQVSRTGVLNPVAVFDPVDLDGAITTRATLHNLSFVKELELGIGDTLVIYRANQVIPKVEENITRSNTLKLPTKCPDCGHDLIVKKGDKCENLYCTNPECSSKNISKLINYCSKTGMDIKDLGKTTLTKFYDLGFIKNYLDIYELEEKHKLEIAKLPGFGVKSANNIFKSIEDSKDTTLSKFLCALSIPMIGKENAKILSKVFNGSWSLFQEAFENHYDFTNIDGISDIINNNLYDWYYGTDKQMLNVLVSLLRFHNGEESRLGNNNLSGKTFCITGKLDHFKNRDELVTFIEQNGGKICGSVTAKTSYLINNDINSSSSKNKKAKQLNVPIITEQSLIDLTPIK